MSMSEWLYKIWHGIICSCHLSYTDVQRENWCLVKLNTLALNKFQKNFRKLLCINEEILFGQI